MYWDLVCLIEDDENAEEDRAVDIVECEVDVEEDLRPCDDAVLYLMFTCTQHVSSGINTQVSIELLACKNKGPWIPAAVPDRKNSNRRKLLARRSQDQGLAEVQTSTIRTLGKLQ